MRLSAANFDSKSTACRATTRTVTPSTTASITPSLWFLEVGFSLRLNGSYRALVILASLLPLEVTNRVRKSRGPQLFADSQQNALVLGLLVPELRYPGESVLFGYHGGSCVPTKKGRETQPYQLSLAALVGRSGESCPSSFLDPPIEPDSGA